VRERILAAGADAFFSKNLARRGDHPIAWTRTSWLFPHGGPGSESANRRPLGS
jgi:hypothetical protein